MYQIDRENEHSAEDRFDRAMLTALAADGRMTVTDLAKRSGLYKSPTQARRKRREKEGGMMGDS